MEKLFSKIHIKLKMVSQFSDLLWTKNPIICFAPDIEVPSGVYLLLIYNKIITKN
jgi:hypothetical protein